MPAPSSTLATLRPDLAGSLMEFDLAMDRQGFIAHRVFPVIDVAEASGNFGIIPVEQLLQNRDTTRAPGAGYSRGNFTFEPATFGTQEHGAEEPVDDNQKAMYRNYFDAEMVSTERARDVILRNWEKRVAAAVFNSSVWTGGTLTTAVSVPWSTAATATPIDDIDAARQAAWNTSGLWANAVIMNRRNFHLARKTAQVIDAIASQGAGSGTKARDVTAQLLAMCFDVDYVLVAGGAKNTASEGQSAAFSQIWGNTNVMVCRVATTQDIQEPCIGRTFRWTEDGNGGSEEAPHIVEQYRDEKVRGDVYRVRHQTDEKRLYTACGHLLSGVSS